MLYAEAAPAADYGQQSPRQHSNGCVGRPDAARAAAVAWRGMAWQIVSTAFTLRFFQL